METKYRVQPIPKRKLKKDATDTWAKMKESYKPENLFTDNGVVYVPESKDDEEELPF